MSQEVRVPAEECVHGGFVRIGETVVSGRLRWYRSTSCPDCKNVEEDGLGLPPIGLRKLLVSEGGYWEIIVQEGSGAAAIKVVKEVLNLSHADAAAQLRCFPVVFQGTLTEAEWLRDHLISSSIAASIVKSVDA